MTEQLGLGLDVPPVFPCAGCNGLRSALCADCEGAAREAASCSEQETCAHCGTPAADVAAAPRCSASATTPGCLWTALHTQEPVRVPRAIEEYLAGFASQYAYGPKPSAAQARQAAIVGHELAERLAAFKQSGAA